jgi:hypothetical protein
MLRLRLESCFHCRNKGFNYVALIEPTLTLLNFYIPFSCSIHKLFCRDNNQNLILTGMAPKRFQVLKTSVSSKIRDRENIIHSRSLLSFKIFQIFGNLKLTD